MARNENPFIHKIPIKDRSGNVVGEKEVIAYRGLLDMVHRDGLRSLRTRLVQVPSKENGETAIVTAVIQTSKGLFTGIGDANPGNVNPKIAPHLIRMAETRAEARAMRKAVNIGVVAIEELGSDLSDDLTLEGEVHPVPSNATSLRRAPEPRPTTPDSRPASPEPQPEPAPPPTPNRATEEQRRYLYRLLAERGIGGDEARGYLQEELGTATVRDASKSSVSALIDRLKRGTKGTNGSANAARGG